MPSVQEILGVPHSYGDMGSTSFQQIADKLGIDARTLAKAQSGWLGSTDTRSLTEPLSISWLDQNMAGRFQLPGPTAGTAITQAQSDASRASSIATHEAASNAAFQAAQAPQPINYNPDVGPYMRDSNYTSPTYGQMIANPSYKGTTQYSAPGVGQFSPSVPSTVGSGALTGGQTKEQLLQQAQQADAQRQAGTIKDIPTLSAALQPGSTGADVATLQNFLAMADTGPAAKALAAAFKSGTKPGFYGDLTKAALAEWQQTLGPDGKPRVQAPVSDYGYFGPKTMAALEDVRKKMSDNPNLTLAEANAGFKSAGVPGITVNGDDGSKTGTPAGLTASSVQELMDYHLSQVKARSKKLEDLTNQLAQATGDYAQGQVHAENRLTDTAMVGGDLARLKQQYAMKTAPIQAQIDAIKTATGMETDEINTALAFWKASQELNQPKTYQLGNDLYEYKNGKYTKVITGKATPTSASTDAATIADVNSQLLQSRNIGAEADGVYADPNLYASLRSKSSLSPTDFDNRFGYLVNPLSRPKLGIGATIAGTTPEKFLDRAFLDTAFSTLNIDSKLAAMKKKREDFASFWKSSGSEEKAIDEAFKTWLDGLMPLIEQYRKAGYTDQDILKMMQ
jgi:hypothetical protein